VQYGYGMTMRDYRGVRLAMHDGGLAGFTCIFRMVPEKRLAVIALGNLSEKSLDEVWRGALELMLPLQPPAAAISVARNRMPMSADEMRKYVGKYVNNPKLACELSIRDGKLYATFTEGDESEGAPVEKIGDLNFVITPEGEPPQLPFLLIPGPGGRIDYLYTNARAFKRVSN
jgi:hypothetical protein